MHLVTAPFITKGQLNNKPILKRIDTKKAPIIASSNLIELILERFSQVQNLDDYLRAEPSHTRIVKQLLHHNFLIPIDKIADLVPSIELEVTNFCNANCIMCPRKELRPLGKMEDKTFDKFFHLLSTIRTNGVIIQGIGEPLLHQNLESYIRKMRKVLTNNEPIVIVSNGSLLNNKKLRRLFNAGLSHVQISFHSANTETYNYIMGKNLYSKVTKNLIGILKEFKDLVSINVVEMTVNKHEIDELKKFLLKYGLPENMVRIIPCFSRGGHLKENLYNDRGNKLTNRCTYVSKSMFISWNGDILPCSNDISGANILTNVNNSSTSEVIQKWLDLVKHPINFSICKQCDKHVDYTYSTEWFEYVQLN